MTDFRAYHVGTAVDGKPVYINGTPYQTWDRPRGTVAVSEDNKTFFYRVAVCNRRAFREWAIFAFSCQSGKHLRGTFPYYRVENA